jgi:hypothetical protein
VYITEEEDAKLDTLVCVVPSLVPSSVKLSAARARTTDSWRSAFLRGLLDPFLVLAPCVRRRGITAVLWPNRALIGRRK